MRRLYSCRFRPPNIRAEKRAWTPPCARQFWCASRRAVVLRNCQSTTARAERPVAALGCTACRALLDRPGQQWGRAIREPEALPQAVMVEVAPRTPERAQQMATELRRLRY